MKTQEITFQKWQPIFIEPIKTGTRTSDNKPYRCVVVRFEMRDEDDCDTGAPTIRRAFFENDAYDQKFFLKYTAHLEQYGADANKPANLASLRPVKARRINKIIKTDADGLPYVFTMLDAKGQPETYKRKTSADFGKPIAVTHFTCLHIEHGLTPEQQEDRWIDTNMSKRITMETLKTYTNSAVQSALSSIDAQLLDNENLPTGN